MSFEKWLRRCVPIALAALFCIIGMLSLATIGRMQGNARVINYAGILRGATQRLVKQELRGVPNDELIDYLENILTEISTGEGENGLIRLPDAEYQNLNAQMRQAWEGIKAEILQVRAGADKQRLFDLSEDYFVLADQAVSASERYSEHQVSKAKVTLIVLNLCFVVLLSLFFLYDRRQKKTQTALEVVENASRAKSDFLSLMSHEIRTPLNGIIGMTEIAQMVPDDREKQADCLKKIGLSSRYLLALINDILDMSRIESGKVELEERRFDLKDLFDHLYGMFQQRAESASIDFHVDCSDLNTTVVIGDDVRLSQVLVNILSNALKFTPPGGQISMKAWQVKLDADALSVEFIVTDTGTGIREEFQSRIFEPFEQAESNTTRQYGGTGLGLSICNSFVKMMGGNISVRSKPGEGSQFTVALTLARPAEQMPEQLDDSRQTQQHTKQTAHDLCGTRVLFAEDNAINAEIVITLLELYGVRVSWVKNGAEAVEAFKAAPGDYTLILLDVQMPVMNGLDAARAIRGLGRAEDAAIPIVALSANVFKEDIDKAMDAGMNEYLAKPLNMEKLIHTVRRYQKDFARPPESCAADNSVSC